MTPKTVVGEGRVTSRVTVKLPVVVSDTGTTTVAVLVRDAERARKVCRVTAMVPVEEGRVRVVPWLIVTLLVSMMTRVGVAVVV